MRKQEKGNRQVMDDRKDRENIESLSEELLHEWCESLRRLQVKGTGNPRLDGGFLCPACGKIHGRCIDAVYPFMRMAQEAETKEERDEWIRSAEGLLDWADHTVRKGEGVYWNDIDSGWTGTTVFFVIALSEAIWYHGAILPPELLKQWKERLRQAAEYIYSMDSLLKNNVNYPISNALALYESGMVLEEKRYQEKAKVFAEFATQLMTENGLLMGEGIPWNKKSGRGCNSVDIGYNIEETLPSLILYGKLSGDKKAEDLAEQYLLSHLDFMLEDGGWDNSFGTRNFKWSYWGSRTSDGCSLGYLLLGEKYPECGAAALRNLKLLKSCTVDGLLMGGPHYGAAGQPPCVHHSFCHAKVVAGILNRKLWETLPAEGGEGSLPKQEGLRAYPEVSVWRVFRPSVTATITAYDWEYLKSGHASGGTLSMLHHKELGTLLCAGTGQYILKERNNMQIPWLVRHECLGVRIEKQSGENVYSSIYEDQAQVTVTDGQIEVTGCLKDPDHQVCPDQDKTENSYRFVYRIEETGLSLTAEFSDGALICPLISKAGETVKQLENGLEIEKETGTVLIKTDGRAELPYGTERIFYLIPGFQAVRLDIYPVDGKVSLNMTWDTFGKDTKKGGEH